MEIKRFEDVVARIQGADPEPGLLDWFRIITDFYLTPKDLVILEAQKAQIESQAKQRVLSVLYCVTQPYLSVKLRKLRTKITTIYELIRHEALIEEYSSAKSILTAYQYSILSYALAGHTQKEISTILGTTHVNAIICVNAAIERLVRHEDRFPHLCAYLKKYKKNFL